MSGGPPALRDVAGGSSTMLLADLDAVAQARSWMSGGGPPDVAGRAAARALLVGRLRTAVLLADTVLVTSAQVLDGVVLLDLGPEELARCLGVGVLDLPLRISCGASGLEEEEAALLTNTGFVWSSRVAHGALPTHTEDATAALLADQRRRWVEVSTWAGLAVPRPAGPLPIAAAHLPEPEQAQAHPHLLGRIRTVPARSEVRRILDEAEGRGELVGPEREEIEHWWTTGYFAAIADQHGARWLDFADDHRRDPARGQHGLPVRGDLVGRLGRMPASTFATIRFHATEPAQAWRAAGTRREQVRALHDLAYVVLRSTQAPRRRQARTRAVLMVVTSLGLAVAAVVTEGLAAAGTSWAVWGAAGVVLLQGAPWDSFATLREVRWGSTRAVVHVGGR